jgi:hypothetical protein
VVTIRSVPRVLHQKFRDDFAFVEVTTNGISDQRGGAEAPI